MDVSEFFDGLRKQCMNVKAACEVCEFRDFCYCTPMTYTEEFLSSVISRIRASLKTSAQG